MNTKNGITKYCHFYHGHKFFACHMGEKVSQETFKSYNGYIYYDDGKYVCYIIYKKNKKVLDILSFGVNQSGDDKRVLKTIKKVINETNPDKICVGLNASSMFFQELYFYLDKLKYEVYKESEKNVWLVKSKYKKKILSNQENKNNYEGEEIN